MHAEDLLEAQVVAPVRETAGQALGAAARGLPAGSLHVLTGHLTALVGQKEWGVRLAGLLGIKYVLAARLDQAGALLPAVLPAVLTGLKVGYHACRCPCAFGAKRNMRDTMLEPSFVAARAVKRQQQEVSCRRGGIRQCSLRLCLVVRRTGRMM